MATKKRNAEGTSVTINADGITIGGGTTNERNLTITAGDVTMTGGGTNDLIFPTASQSVIPSHGQCVAFHNGYAMP